MSCPRLFRSVLTACLLGAAIAAVAAPSAISCRVVGVADGDTLTCLTVSHSEMKVRLAQIDAPERKQEFGARSKQALADMVFGRQVRLETVTTDRYNRTVAKVVLDGQDVNLAMVRKGMAWTYDRYAKDPAYFAAHDAAKKAKIGLWSYPSPVPPWEFRRGG